MPVSLRMTVLDQTPIHENRTRADAPSTSVDLAIECEKLGYYRYWLAEHHNSIHFAGSVPEILLTRIASATARMRIGSGGVMLTHYSPYKVAETFSLLAGLFPARIDLGIGRAPGGSQLSSMALASPGNPPHHDHFPQQSAELCAFLRGDLPSDHPYKSLADNLATANAPSLWMLGSGGGSSELAGRLGMGLALARFISPHTCSPTIFQQHTAAYRKADHESPVPRLLALAVICAPCEQEARFIAGTAAYRKLMAGNPRREPLLSPSEVERRYQQMRPDDRREFDDTLDSMVVGSPESCRAKIYQLAEEYGCDEIAVLTVTYRYEDRLKSYQLLARALGIDADTGR